MSHENASLIASQWDKYRDFGPDDPQRIMANCYPFSYLERLYVRLFHLLPRITGLRDAKVLELGCGGGQNLFTLTQCGVAREAIGIDLSKGAIEGALEQLNKKGVGSDRITFMQQSFENFSCHDKFDLVVSMQFLNYVEDIDLFFRKISMYTKNKSYLIVYDAQRPRLHLVSRLKRFILSSKLFGLKPRSSDTELLHYREYDLVRRKANEYQFSVMYNIFTGHFVESLVAIPMYRLAMQRFSSEKLRIAAKAVYLMLRAIVEVENRMFSRRQRGLCYFVVFSRR